MVKGRKPKPTHLKIIEGNPGKRALHQHGPVPRSVFPEKPVFTTEVASDCWDRVVVELEAMGVLHAADRDALHMYCETFGTWIVAQALVSTEGIKIEGREQPALRSPGSPPGRAAGEEAGPTPESFNHVCTSSESTTNVWSPLTASRMSAW